MLTDDKENVGQNTDNQEQAQEQGSFMQDVWEQAEEGSFGLEDDAEREKREQEESASEEAQGKEETSEEEEEQTSEEEKSKEEEAAKTEEEEEEKKEEKDDEDEDDKKKEGEEEEENELPENYQELVNTIKAIDPDAEIETTDDIVKYSKKIGEDLAKVKQENEANQKVYQEFVEVLESDPVAANFMNDLKNGASFEEAIMLNIDPENIDMDDSPDLDNLKKRKQERQQQYQAMRERQKEIEKNKETSLSNIESFAKENEYDNEQMGGFIDRIRNFMDDYDKGLISKDFLKVLDKAMNADTQAERKAEAARIAARNEKMAQDAMKKKKKQKGDGLPHLKGNNKVQEEATKEKNDWADAIDQYKQSQVRL